MSFAVSVQDSNLPWWVALVQGVASIIVGVLLVTNPGATTLFLVQILGLYWLIMGIVSVSIVSIFADRTAWGWKLFLGILG